MTILHSPADDGRKNSSESSCYAYIYCYFYVFTQLYKSLKHYILIKNINKFISDNSHVIKTCRNCLNVFYSEIKYKDHI